MERIHLVHYTEYGNENSYSIHREVSFFLFRAMVIIIIIIMPN